MLCIYKYCKKTCSIIHFLFLLNMLYYTYFKLNIISLLEYFPTSNNNNNNNNFF